MNEPASPTPPRTRSITVEREVAASPEAVWETLTTSEGLERWFPLEAHVEPGVGGSVRLSWGPGSEGEAPIRIWQPPHRFGWSESYGEDADGNPIEVAVDFFVEGREGTTVVRLVQSGLSAAQEWDEMYDALEDGWTYFLFNLAFYLLRHAGKDRKMVWRRAPTELARDVVWERLVEGALVAATVGGGGEVVLDRSREASLVSQRPGYHYAATLPDLDDGILFVELEGRHVGVWISTYGLDDARVAQLQGALDVRVAEILEG